MGEVLLYFENILRQPPHTASGDKSLLRGGVFIELMTSDRELKASTEDSK